MTGICFSARAQASLKDLKWHMCANYTPTSKEQIEARFGVRWPQLYLPPEAWPGYMAPILRGSHEVPGELQIAHAMFGMVLHWADLKLARRTSNVRAEKVASSRAHAINWRKFAIF